MSTISQLSIMSAASIVRVYDPSTIVTETSIRAVLDDVFSKKHGFTPGTFIIEIIHNIGGDNFAIVVDWPPFPIQPEHPNPGAYRAATKKIAEGIDAVIRRVRPSCGIKKIQVSLSNFERRLGDLTNYLSVFAVEVS